MTAAVDVQPRLLQVISACFLEADSVMVQLMTVFSENLAVAYAIHAAEGEHANNEHAKSEFSKSGSRPRNCLPPVAKPSCRLPFPPHI